MSAFTTNFAITPFVVGTTHHFLGFRWMTNRQAWKLYAPLHWEIAFKDSGFWITVPEGFETDLASIPRWARWLFNPYDPETAKAVCVHDWLCPTLPERAAEGFEVGRLRWEPRFAAGELYAALKAGGVPMFRRIVYYLAVVAASTEW